MVAVHQEEPGIDNRNALPWSRIFLVPPTGQRADIGEGNWVTDVAARQRIALKPGRILLLPGNRLYAFRFQPKMIMTGTHFRLEWAPGCDAFAEDARPRFRDDLHELSARAWAAVATDDTLGAVARLRGILLEACGEFLDHDWAWADARLAARRRLGPLLDRLEADPRMDWSTATAAKVLGVTREHCSRTFRELVGTSLKEHRDRRLAEHACRRIVAGELLEAIAEALGFSSAFALSRFVKRRTGVSPAGLRRAMG
jgi:AraC-like DNA-binding protein